MPPTNQGYECGATNVSFVSAKNHHHITGPYEIEDPDSMKILNSNDVRIRKWTNTMEVTV